MANLGLAPSEVRQMTVGEIYAIIAVKTKPERSNTDAREEMWQANQRLNEELE